MDTNTQNSIIESLILASPEPLSGKKISALLEGVTNSVVAKAVAELNSRYSEMGSSFRIREIAGGYQYYVMPEFTGYVEEMFARTRKLRLTRAALETLAIVAYKQPVTKTDIEQIRGVASDGVVQNLLEKNMLTITGRAQTVGKPLQYGTTDEFLKFFGINSLADLPKMSEIEALISATDKENQTEFHFEESDFENNGSKLNVALDNEDIEKNEIESAENETQNESDEGDSQEESDSQEIDETTSDTEDGVVVDLDKTS